MTASHPGRFLARVLVAGLAFAGATGGGVLSGAESVAPVDEAALRQRIRDLRAGVRDVPLPLIIEELSGHTVHPWQGQQRDELAAVARDVLAAVEREPLAAARVNEAGNAIENHVLAALAAHGFRAGLPAGPSGRAHAAGYPDLEATSADGATTFYVEVKTYSATTEDSAQRSFYLSPGTDFKITRDAIHLLIAVQLVPAGPERYSAASVRWLDLSGLRCDLKHEFNANNRDLYRPESGLVILEVAPKTGE
jgi:hypothetical protein